MSTDLDALLRIARREPLWDPASATLPVPITGAALQALLPHRPPFLLVDAITAYDVPTGRVAGRRWVDPADPVFAGHFPGNPVYPGVLLLEAMAQLTAAFGPIEVGGEPQSVFATSYRSFFLLPVFPGDELVLLARRVGKYDGLYDRGLGQVLRNGQICAAAVIEGCHVDA